MKNEDLEKLDEIGIVENKWWKMLNPKSLQCQRDCKQSTMAETLFCSQYQKVEDKNDKE